MEVKQPSVRDYWRGYRRMYVRLVIISQLVIALSIYVIAIIGGVIDPTEWVYLLAIAGIFLIGTGITFTTMSLLIDPTTSMLRALMYRRGENTTTTPPNPNAKHYKENGFKTVLQTIYDDDRRLADKLAHDAEANPRDSLIIEALDQIATGLVLFNDRGEIIESNKSAPVVHKSDTDAHLALDFINQQNLTDWIAECSENSIHAEKVWRRVPVEMGFSENKKIYDVIANFNKNARVQTTVLLIDQSERYAPEENDLNFISFAAHELRGPITVIRGYLDIIRSEFADRLKGDEAQLLDRLVVSSNRLTGYINNILNVSRFDRHHLQVHLVEERVSDIYASIADDMMMRAKAQHRMINVDFPDNLPTVAADRASISEVLGNLIDNAIKYSFEGGLVHIFAEKKGDMVEISVRDEGIGMPPNVVENLFHKFYRSHRSRETVAGTGIGLYISKAFVESNGGSISVRSQDGQGSTFSFTLPVYATVKDTLLENGQLNQKLIHRGGGWIKNHKMYKG